MKGFTLIELLLTVTVVALLAVTVLVSLNPATRIRDAKNARRTTDVDTILAAIHTSIVDTSGTYPTGLSAGMNETQIGSGTTGGVIATGGCAVTPTGCVNLATPLASYLASMPIDPSGGSTYTAAKTGYSVVVNSSGIITIKACGAESTTISISR
jgi:prepilin-type N-terminal cleavage/methylation domain-containing protein